MDPIKAKFFQSSFEIEFQGQKLEMRGLVSEWGVTKIFLPGGLPDFWRDAMGQAIIARIDGISFSAVLLRHTVEHGIYYELRFPNIDENQKAFLRQRVAAEGISPGWKREFPRIPVTLGEDPELPVPNLCIVHFLGKDIFVNVMNFTLGGLRIETIGDNLSELRVGALLQFDLLTSTGAILADLSAEVRNISLHEHEEGARKNITRSFGLRIKNMDPVNDRKYRDLIRDYCLVLQKRFEK